jgi:hypothetical protein
MKTKKILLVTMLISAFVLDACNLGFKAALPTQQPTATSTPLPAASNPSPGADCLVGTWQMQDFNHYVQTLLNQALSQFGNVGEVSSSGAVRYSFGPDGNLTVVADQLELKTKISVSIFPVSANILVSGSASADYLADESSGKMTISNFNPGDLTITADANGKPFDQQIDPSILLFSTSHSPTAIQYQCSENSLQLTIPIPQLPARIVVLKRIAP